MMMMTTTTMMMMVVVLGYTNANGMESKLFSQNRTALMTTNQLR